MASVEFLRTTVKKLSWEYPFWNRTGGTDHVFFLTTDRGGCWKPWALQDSLIISYLGFRASEGYFGFEERLMWPRQGPNNRNNAYSIRPGSEALDLDCYVEGKACRRAGRRGDWCYRRGEAQMEEPFNAREGRTRCYYLWEAR